MQQWIQPMAPATPSTPSTTRRTRPRPEWLPSLASTTASVWNYS